MSIAFGPTSAEVRGVFDPTKKNYFCRDCRRIVHVRKRSPGFRASPTPGCTRPAGFGVYATMPIPLVRLQWRTKGRRAG